MFNDLPAIDHDRFWDQYTIRYGVSEEDATPEGQREIYFTEALDDAFKIRELQSKKKLDDKHARELRWLLEALPAYLDETETFFGTENAKTLRGLLRQHAGFEFTENYELTEENMARAKVKMEGPTIDTSKMSNEEFKQVLDEVSPEETDSKFILPLHLLRKNGPIDKAVDPAAIYAKKPVSAFSFAGAQYVLSGAAGELKGEHLDWAIGWKIVPLSEFNGKLKAENDNVSGYHGVKVTVGDAEFVMTGPAVTFMPGEVPEREPAVEKQIEEPSTAKTPVAEIGPRDVRSIALDQLIVSDFEPQKRRRARFTEEEVGLLAIDIAANNLMHPIVVRPVADKFQIVVGERRFLAVKHLGWTEIDATVRELTDEQAFDLQYSENSKRKDVHPIDEAYNFKCLQDRFEYDIEGIALHTGHKPAYIAARLKLITLHPQVQESFESGAILFGHALEIARYKKEDQPELLEYATIQGQGKAGYIAVPKLRDRIDEFYLRKLSKAPFSIKSADLRDDGLKCVECPERTSSKQTLFDDLSEEDRCLDPQCWTSKVQRFVQIQRIKTALGSFDPKKEITKSDAAKVKNVLLVSDGWLAQGEKPSEPYAEKYSLREVKSGECELSETGIFFNGAKVGQKIHYCKDQACKVHNRTTRQAAKEDPTDRLKRKEELFDIHVGEAVRRKVLTSASETFAKEFVMSGDQDLLVRLVAQLWDTAGSNPYSIVKRTIVEQALGEKITITEFGWEFENKVKVLETVPEVTLKRILFLFANGLKGEMYNEKFKSQAPVRTLAETYGIDYVLLDAEERLTFAQSKHAKHQDLFKKYLDDVRAGKKAKPPRPYFEKYKIPE